MAEPAIIHTQAVDDATRARRRQTLFDTLCAAASATAALAEWARARGWDDRIVARKLEADLRPAPEDVREALGAAAGAVIGFRKVELLSGERVLSRADNWFMPERLPAPVIAALGEGSSPFGALIAPLEPRRELLGRELLGQELPGAEKLWGRAGRAPPPELFRITAIVTGVCDGARCPLALVNETYMAELVL